MEKPNVTVTFFDSGKVNVTGGKPICLFLNSYDAFYRSFFLIHLAKKFEDINDAYDEVLDILKEFMKK